MIQEQIQKRYFSISEAAQKLEVEPSALRYWEKEFNVFVQKDHGGRGGTRFYTPENLEAFALVKTYLKEFGFTIPGAIRQFKIKGLKYFNL